MWFHELVRICKTEITMWHLWTGKGAEQLLLKSSALFYVTGRGGCMPAMLVAMLQWAQLIPQLCLTVLKDILRGTENAHDFTGGQQTAHFLSDQELYIKEKAAIIRTQVHH